MGKLGCFITKTKTATSAPREGEPVGTQEEEEEDKGGDDGESKYRRFSIFNVFSSWLNK